MTTAINIKERGIPFGAPMVRAIWDDSKFETRRTRGLDLFNGEPSRWRLEGEMFAFDGGFEYHPVPKCPYGKVGDRLWVKETGFWFLCDEAETVPEGAVVTSPFETYNRETRCFESIRTAAFFAADGPKPSLMEGRPWKSYRYMPKWASRITLEITEIRVERLQDISDDDILREGVKPDNFGSYAGRPWDNRRACFQELWESIHGPSSWRLNPWLWVISFKRVP